MGPAGTGKTAMLAAAKASLDGQGRDLVVLAPTRKAAQVAAEELGAPASSVAKVLYDYGWRWDDLGRYTRPVGPGPDVPGPGVSGPGVSGPGVSGPGVSGPGVSALASRALASRASPVPPLGGPTRGRGTVPACRPARW